MEGDAMWLTGTRAWVGDGRGGCRRLLRALVATLLLRPTLPIGPAEAQSSTCFVAANPPEIAVGPNAYGIAVGDLNNDGNLDFAVPSALDNSVTLQAGDGTGHFRSLGQVAVGKGPRAVALGDLNNDGKLTVAVASF